MLPIGLAAVLLAFAGLGLWAAGGRGEARTRSVEVPARVDRPLSTTTTAPSATTPRTSAPSPAVDLTTPKVKVSDTDGRFDITVPRSWVSLIPATRDTIAWQLLEQDAAGDPVATGFQFIVGWFDSAGCDLDGCAAQQADRLASSQPGLAITTTQTTVAGLPGRQLDAATSDRRVVDWVVVQGDRYWVVQLIGPIDGFEDALAKVEPVVATMSFG